MREERECPYRGKLPLPPADVLPVSRVLAMTGPRIPGARIGNWHPTEIEMRNARLTAGARSVKASGHVADLWEPKVGDKPYNNLRWDDDNPTKSGLAHLAMVLGISEPAIVRRAVEMMLRDFADDADGTYVRMTTLWRRPERA